MPIMLVVAISIPDQDAYIEFKKTVSVYARSEIKEGVWLIDTSFDVEKVLCELRYRLGESDTIFVSEIEQNWAFLNGGRSEEWLSSKRRRFRKKNSRSFLSWIFGKTK